MRSHGILARRSDRPTSSFRRYSVSSTVPWTHHRRRSLIPVALWLHCRLGSVHRPVVSALYVKQFAWKGSGPVSIGLANADLPWQTHHPRGRVKRPAPALGAQSEQLAHGKHRHGSHHQVDAACNACVGLRADDGDPADVGSNERRRARGVDRHRSFEASVRSRPASHSWAHDFPPRHTTMRAAPAATGGLPGPGRMQCGTALQPALGLKTGIEARGCVAHTPCNRNNTIRRGYKQVSQGCRPGQGTRNVSGSPGVDDDDDTALKRLRFGIEMYWKRREGDPFGTFRVLGGHFVRIN